MSIACTCGTQENACCPSNTGKGACAQGLLCCDGNPYPAGGECEPVCELKSDRNLKENITPVTAEKVLQRLASLPITSWNYISEGPSVKHLGPMAQDFHAAFGLGSSDRSIALVDANGVVMLSIQALYQGLAEVRESNRALRRENSALRKELSQLRQATLRSRVENR